MTDPCQMRLRSAIRGRERWEVKALRRRPEIAQELEAAILQHPGVSGVRANPVSGRVLVIYSPEYPDLNIESLLRDNVQRLSQIRFSEIRVAKKSNALTRILKSTLPKREELIAPPILSVLGHSLHILQGLSFIGTVNTARGEGPGFLRSLGLVKAGARLAFMSGLTVFLTCGDLWVQYQRRKAWRKLARATEHRLRARMVARIQGQDLSFFNDHSTGDLIRRVTEDTAQIERFVERAGDEVIEKSLTIAVASSVLISSSWRLALLASLPMPFIMISSRFFGRMAAERYAHLGETASQYNQKLENNLAGIADVKSFTGERREARRLHDSNLRMEKAAMEAEVVASIQTHLAQGIFATGFTLTAWYGGRLLASERMSPSEYLRVVYWFPQLLGALTGIEQLTRMYYGATHSAERLAEVLDSRPKIRSGPINIPARTVRGEIIFEDVTFGYSSSVKVLQNVSFHLRPGETLAIVGPTGSGKSTLLRLLMRFYDVDSGRILLDGKDIRQLNLKDLRAAISWVSQDVYLFQGTVQGNVTYGKPHASEEQIIEAMRDASALNLLTALPDGLESEVGERGRHLSGGERQRVAIARALLKGAPILALDEATSHLDYETESAIKRSLRNVATGRSVLMIAHRLSTIRNADNILVLERGKIREQGNHEELLAQEGLYASLWQLQNGEGPFGSGLEVRITDD
ncbi:MAG: ABC transporter ATP-binding protein [Blastocatellia bacterium]